MSNIQLSSKTLQKYLQDSVAPLFSASVVAHDMCHLSRVANLSLTISDLEGGNQVIVLTAAYLHDYHRLLEKKYGRYVSPEEAEPEIINVLKSFPFIECGLYGEVCRVINFTEYYKCAGDDIQAMNPSIEAKIVRDADMLDALGAVGIARAFMYGGYLGEPIWDSSSVLEGFDKKFVHGKTSSIVSHFHEKLLHLENEMLTQKGRSMAIDRTRFMRDFLNQLMVEI